MDMRDMEADIQRLIGYDFIVTSGLRPQGPHLDFHSGSRMLRIWIPREGVDTKRVASLLKEYSKDLGSPAYKELVYEEVK